MNLHEIGTKGSTKRSEASLGDALDRAAKGNGKTEIEDAEATDIPESPNDGTRETYTEKMARAQTSNEGRDIIEALEKEIEALEMSAGLRPTCGQIAPKHFRGFSTVKPSEWKKAIRELQKEGHPEKAELLKMLVHEGGIAHRDFLDRLIPLEHGGVDRAKDAQALAEAVQERTVVDVRNLPALIDKERALRPYEDGEDYNLARITRRIQECGVTILEQMINVGKYLIWVKETEGHGEFLKWLDRELNISRYRAAEFMRIAHRVIGSNVRTVRTFLLQTAGDSKMKLLALLDVKDEEIQEAMQTDSFLGKKLDELESMSYRQMMAELRKEKDRRKKSDTQAKELEHTVSEMKTELHNLKHAPAPKPPKASDLEPWELQFSQCIVALGILEKEIYRLIEAEGDEGHRRRTGDWQSAVATLSQKVTAISQAACPEDMFLEQLGILPAKDTPPDAPAEG